MSGEDWAAQGIAALIEDCPQHWPTVMFDDAHGPYPFIRCYRCPYVVPLAEAPVELVEDCVRALREGVAP